VADHAITQWPGGALCNAIFIIQKKLEQFIKTFLIAANPFTDAVGLSLGMLSQYGFPEIHRAKAAAFFIPC
jgi:hypothetical protein